MSKKSWVYYNNYYLNIWKIILMHWRQHRATYWYKKYVSLLLITIQEPKRNIQFESKHCEHQYYRTTKIGTDRIAQLKKRSTIHTSYTVIQVYKRGVHSALSVATVASNIIRLMDWQYQINITRSKKAKNNKSQSTVDNSSQCKKRRAHSALCGATVVSNIISAMHCQYQKKNRYNKI